MDENLEFEEPQLESDILYCYGCFGIMGTIVDEVPFVRRDDRDGVIKDESGRHYSIDLCETCCERIQRSSTFTTQMTNMVQEKPSIVVDRKIELSETKIDDFLDNKKLSNLKRRPDADTDN